MLVNSNVFFLKTMLFFIFIIIMFFLSPVVTSIFLALVFYFSNKKWGVFISILLFAFVVFLSQYTLNLQGNKVGDIYEYYRMYDEGYQNAFLRFSFYQGYFFDIISRENVSVTIYGAVSVAIIILICYGLSFVIIERLGLKINSFNKKLIFLIFLISFYKLTMYYSFTNALSFSFFYLYLYFYIRYRDAGPKRILVLVIISPIVVLSVFTHNASTPLFFILIISQLAILKKFRVLFLILVFSGVFLSFNYASFLSSLDIPFVSMIFKKIISYTTNGEKIGFIQLSYNIMYASFFWYLYHKNHKYVNAEGLRLDKFFVRLHSYAFVYLSFSSALIITTTLGGRYLQMGTMILLPYVFFSFSTNPLLRGKRSKVVLFLFLFFNVFSYANIYFIRSSRLLSFANGEFFLLTLNGFFNYH